VDFEFQPSQALEGFRREIRSWFDDNVPDGLPAHRPQDASSAVGPDRVRDLQRRLADMGWAVPSWPREFGGGGLTPDHDTVLREEMDASGIPPLFENNLQVATAVMAWGDDAQRARFLRPLLRGDFTAWRSAGEADAVSDPETVSTVAVKDGDDYIVSGEGLFYGDLGGPSHFWVLAVTNPEAPAHLRLSAFLVPANLLGLLVSEAETMAGGARQRAAMDGVRVSVDLRIGEEGVGWAVAQSSLETEADADREVREQRVLVAKLVGYTKNTLRGRQPLFQYKQVRQKVVESYIDAHVLRLLSLRNQWMRREGVQTTYHSAQYAIMAKGGKLKLASTMLETMGPYSLLSDHQWAPMNGEAEAFQRASLPGAKPGDSIVVQETLMGSRLGLQATQEA
jgi:alkylation response protein AidB-like acyl-CoA dehydrogenase